MSALLSDEFLTAAEVKDLTGEATPDRQELALKRERIPFKRRGNRMLVSRYHCRQWLADIPVAPSRGANLAVVK